MSELELKITVMSSGPNIGELVRKMYIDGDNGSALVLASDGYTIDIVKLERMDGLPLAIEEDFTAWWCSQGGGSSPSRHVAYQAYIAGRAAK